MPYLCHIFEGPNGPNGELIFFFGNPMQHVLFRRCEGRGD